MQTLRSAFRRDEVVVVVLAEYMGALGDADPNGRLSDEFRPGLDSTGGEVDLGDKNTSVEAVSRELGVEDPGGGGQVYLVVLVIEEELEQVVSP